MPVADGKERYRNGCRGTHPSPGGRMTTTQPETMRMTMAMRDLIPWNRNNRSSLPSVPSSGELDPFFTLHRDVNRLFDETLRRFDPGLPSTWGGSLLGGQGWPSVEVNATDKEVRVSAELPGLDEKDVELLIDDGMLTIRGEKKSDVEDKDRGF